MPWPVSAGHLSGKPDGAAAQDGMTCAIVGANDYSPLQNGHNELPPRRGAQIIKQAKLEIIISGIVADASHLRNYTKMRYAKLYNQKICNELFAMAESGIPLLLAEE